VFFFEPQLKRRKTMKNVAIIVMTGALLVAAAGVSVADSPPKQGTIGHPDGLTPQNGVGVFEPPIWDGNESFFRSPSRTFKRFDGVLDSGSGDFEETFQAGPTRLSGEARGSFAGSGPSVPETDVKGAPLWASDATL
jgi:hypothetical protein